MQRVTEFRMLIVACWMLSLTCFSVPGRGGPLDLSSFDAIAILKTAVRAGACLLVITALLRLNFHPRAMPVLRRLLPFAVFASWVALSFIWSPLKAVTLGHALELITLVAIAIAAGILVDSEDRRSRVYLHLFLALTLTTLAVLVLDFQAIWHGERPAGYMHPNALGAISASGLILLLASHFFFAWPWSRRLLVPGAFICSAGLYAARSRTSLGAGIIIIGALCFKARRRATVLAIFVAASIVLALMPYVRQISDLPESVEKYVMRGQTRDDLAEASGRQELWTRALISFRDSPLLGHGYFMLSRTGTMYVWLKNQYQTAHSLYLHVLTGTGIAGALLFIWACAAAIGRPVASPQSYLLWTLTAWFALVGLFELSVLGPVDPTSVLYFATLGAAAVPVPAIPVSQFLEVKICA